MLLKAKYAEEITAPNGHQRGRLSYLTKKKEAVRVIVNTVKGADLEACE